MWRITTCSSSLRRAGRPGRADDPLDHQPHLEKLRLRDRGGRIRPATAAARNASMGALSQARGDRRRARAHGLRTSNVSGVTMNLRHARDAAVARRAGQFHHDGGAGVGRANGAYDGWLSDAPCNAPLPAAAPMAGTARNSLASLKRWSRRLCPRLRHQVLLRDQRAEVVVVGDERADEFVQAGLEDLVHPAVLQPRADLPRAWRCAGPWRP